MDCGFTCPTRDGSISTEGCLYCNNESFSPLMSGKIIPVKEQILSTLNKYQNSRKGDVKKYFSYFQSYTNTYASIKELEQLYKDALDFPEITGLCIGTRPDCINDDILNLLSEINKDNYVSLEIGIESVYDKTLKWVNRGHDFKTTTSTIERIAKEDIHISGHYILGFPTETIDEMLKSASILNSLPIDALKIHHLHIVKNTKLALEYKNKKFYLFSEKEWISFICDYLEQLRSDIVIQRLVGDAQGDTLIAPNWKTQKTIILQNILDELIKRDSYQGIKDYH